ncbi:hypothetical protein [Caldivirga sp. UBA161]|uniref:hypothetical protein n=1 Tax=Caldivirga sp. UBA161 TaxID=1915569 RepID=UPI0025C71A86|nr:hypothetical protein [Caldivirga sp. UBA161]
MDVIGYIIITVALIAVAGLMYYYVNYYVTYNMLNVASYLESLIYNAITHEFQTAVALASLSQVTGSFQYRLTLPTATLPGQGISLYYTVTLYPDYLSNGGLGLFLNITIKLSTSSFSLTVRRSGLTVLSSQQPVVVSALNCLNSQTPVTLINPNWSTLPNPPPSCTWSSSLMMYGLAYLNVTKVS